MNAESILSFDRMTYRYGSTEAVTDLRLHVDAKEMFGLIGPDGAGKTTSLRVALGLLKPSGGKVLTCGMDPLREKRKLSSVVGYLSQRFSLYGDLTVDENISFFADIHGVRSWRKRRDELLDLVRMRPFRSRLAARLSGGMKQKLALACTLIHRPKLLILDEPTAGVDPVSRRDFWRLLADIQQQNLTILTTTPYLDEAERCQRIGLMHQGRLLLVDDPQAVRGRFNKQIIEVLAKPRRKTARLLEKLDVIERVEVFGERLHAVFASTQRQRDRDFEDLIHASLAEADIQVTFVRAIQPTLEDVFISQMREPKAPQKAAY